MASQILQSLLHPEEVFAMFRYKLDPAFKAPKRKELSSEMAECYRLLDLTSRSFAMVIQQLDDELRPAICIFYLVLRGLDTIEDDMTIPLDKKIPLLHNFDTFIRTPGWTFTESGPNEKDAHLLVQFHVVIHEFLKLKPVFQEAIAEITRKMAFGMTEFMGRPVNTLEDWNLYCHYVAGLVGIGLSKIFSASSLESPAVAQREDLSNSMGLFLQKTNIIRDYLEDIEQGRVFWPKQVWQLYVPAGRDLSVFQEPEHLEQALNCLNHLINNALQHVPDVLEYMAQLKNRSVFNFCAIPQVMAIATLAACYNNPKVFRGVVKIRKGEACKLIIKGRTMEDLREIFDAYLVEMRGRTPTRGGFLAKQTVSTIQRIRQEHLADVRSPPSVSSFALLSFFISLLLAAALLAKESGLIPQ